MTKTTTQNLLDISSSTGWIVKIFVWWIWLTCQKILEPIALDCRLQSMKDIEKGNTLAFDLLEWYHLPECSASNQSEKEWPEAWCSMSCVRWNMHYVCDMMLWRSKSRNNVWVNINQQQSEWTQNTHPKPSCRLFGHGLRYQQEILNPKTDIADA